MRIVGVAPFHPHPIPPPSKGAGVSRMGRRGFDHSPCFDREPRTKPSFMTGSAKGLRIGTRGSPLALAQARSVREPLAAAHPDLPRAEIVVIKTTGDQVQDRKLDEIGGKGLFTKEIEEALIEGRIDLAVHSMKDMPTQLPDGLVIDCLLKRADPRDALFSPHAKSLAGPAQGRQGRNLLAAPPGPDPGAAPRSEGGDLARQCGHRASPSSPRAWWMPHCWRWPG